MYEDPRHGQADDASESEEGIAREGEEEEEAEEAHPRVGTASYAHTHRYAEESAGAGAGGAASASGAVRRPLACAPFDDGNRIMAVAPQPPAHPGGPLSGPAFLNAHAARAAAAAVHADPETAVAAGLWPGSGSSVVRHVVRVQSMEPRRGPVASASALELDEQRREEELHKRVALHRRNRAAAANERRQAPSAEAGRPTGAVEAGGWRGRADAPRPVVGRDPIALMREELCSPESLLSWGGLAGADAEAALEEAFGVGHAP